MAAQKPPMRVMKRDEQEYKRLRKNYRSKLYRIRKKTNFSLPSEVIDKELDLMFPDIQSFREGAFENRQSFNAFKKKVEEVTSKTFKPLQIETNAGGMKYPQIMQTYAATNARRAQQQADRERAKLKDLPLIIDGEERGTVADREESVTDDEAYGIYRPSDFDIDEYTNPQSVEKRIEKDIHRQTGDYYDERKQQLLDNYISIFQDKDGVPQDIIDKLQQINPNQFYEMYLMIPEMAFENWDSETGFHITGDPDAFEHHLRYYLDTYLEGGLDLSLSDIG